MYDGIVPLTFDRIIMEYRQLANELGHCTSKISMCGVEEI